MRLSKRAIVLFELVLASLSHAANLPRDSSESSSNSSQLKKRSKTRLFTASPIYNARLGVSDKQKNVQTFKIDFVRRPFKNYGMLYLEQEGKNRAKFVVSTGILKPEHTEFLCDGIAHGAGKLLEPPLHVIDMDEFQYIPHADCKATPTVHNKFQVLCGGEQTKDNKKAQEPLYLFCPHKPFFFDQHGLLSIRNGSLSYTICPSTFHTDKLCTSIGASQTTFHYHFKPTDKTDAKSFASLICGDYVKGRTWKVDEVCSLKVLDAKCPKEDFKKISCQPSSHKLNVSEVNGDLYYKPERGHEMSVSVVFSEKRVLKLWFEDHSSGCRGISFFFDSKCFIYQESHTKAAVTCMRLLCKSFGINFYPPCLLHSSSTTILAYRSARNKRFRNKVLVVGSHRNSYKLTAPFLLSPVYDATNKSSTLPTNPSSLLPNISNINFLFSWWYRAYLTSKKELLFEVSNWKITKQTTVYQHFHLKQQKLHLFIYLQDFEATSLRRKKLACFLKPCLPNVLNFFSPILHRSISS